jgi:hypothetical protein
MAPRFQRPWMQLYLENTSKKEKFGVSSEELPDESLNDHILKALRLTPYQRKQMTISDHHKLFF